MSDKLLFYLGNFDKPECNAAGKRVYGNALLLADLGYRVVLIGKNKTLNNEESVRYKRGIMFYSFPHCALYKTAEYIQYVERIIEREGRPSIIIRYGSPGLAFFDLELLKNCRKRNIKVIADVVDWLPAGGTNVLFNTIKSIDTYLEKVILNKRSDGIIAISSYISNYYKRKGRNTVIIPPLVEDYKKNTTKNDKIRVVYAGIPFRLGVKVKNEKGVKDRLDLAVNAISKVSENNANIEFDIYGITVEQYLTAYPHHKELIEATRKNVLFYGKKHMEEVQKAVNQSDYMILLRNKTRATMAGFPTKVVESLSLGTPVITTRTSDLDKYIVNNQNGFLVSIDNIKDIEEQLNHIFNLGTSNIQRMKEYCNMERQFTANRFRDDMQRFIYEIEKS